MLGGAPVVEVALQRSLVEAPAQGERWLRHRRRSGGGARWRRRACGGGEDLRRGGAADRERERERERERDGGRRLGIRAVGALLLRVASWCCGSESTTWAAAAPSRGRGRRARGAVATVGEALDARLSGPAEVTLSMEAVVSCSSRLTCTTVRRKRRCVAVCMATSLPRQSSTRSSRQKK
ncbi:hypothetical protein BRADI_3g54465v3 [Brachypodium distachyon]|uniref:Uncharacterized protein n=1 Tax=Brachypodium distachyon TaxID=15368 RepID=A0A2K2D525_BRADI|nr:hypothetical protein BRADI_3g54465v3 [Brachypodium distachyon]